MSLRYWMILFVIAVPFLLSAQGRGTLLLMADAECTVLVDGAEEVRLQPQVPATLKLPVGQHLIWQQCTDRQEIVTIVKGEQQVMQIKTAAGRLRLAELELSLQSDFRPKGLDKDGDFATSRRPVFPYFLQQGDQLLLRVAPTNAGGRASVRVYSYPSGGAVFSRTDFDSLPGQRIPIPQDGIYVVELTTSAATAQPVKVNLDRIPGGSTYRPSRVERRREYEPVSVQSPLLHRLNSTSNAYLRGGTARVALPVVLPAGTVEWYYVFTASREEGAASGWLQAANLLGQLSAAVGGLPGKAVKTGLDMVATPPGSDYCDVLLFEESQLSRFQEGEDITSLPEGSRDNVTSGKVRVTHIPKKPLYLGIRNEDSVYGISVGLEVVALVAKEYYAPVEQ